MWQLEEKASQALSFEPGSIQAFKSGVVTLDEDVTQYKLWKDGFSDTGAKDERVPC